MKETTEICNFIALGQAIKKFREEKGWTREVEGAIKGICKAKEAED